MAAKVGVYFMLWVILDLHCFIDSKGLLCERIMCFDGIYIIVSIAAHRP